MVLSKLNKNITFVDKKTVEPEDVNRETDLYTANINGIYILVAFGLKREDFIDFDIVYFPIYLVKKNKKSIQIGIIETYNTDRIQEVQTLDSVIDDVNMVPLLFDFVSDTYLIENSTNVDGLETSNEFYDKEEPDELMDFETNQPQVKNIIKKNIYNSVIPEHRADIFNALVDFPEPIFLIQETAELANKIIEEYNEKKEHKWIQKFMKNENYNIENIEENGDCLFTVIKNAFYSIGQETTTQNLREKLAKNITEDTFKNYRDKYEVLFSNIEKNKQFLVRTKQEHKKLVERVKAENFNDEVEKKEIVMTTKRLKENYDEIKKETELMIEELNDVKHLKGVENIEDFRKLVKTCSFWSDEKSISTLERILKIKFIIFSKQAYQDGDLPGVLRCSKIEDVEMENTGSFTPDFYIMVEKTNHNYKLITYKNKKILTFQEIPYHTKKLIIDKCLEMPNSVFSIIPEFRELKNRMKGTSVGTTNRRKHRQQQQTRTVLINQSEIQNLYDDDIVFMVYRRASNEKTAPGSGTGEEIKNIEKIKQFAMLKNIVDWRKKLDNYWESEFLLDDKRWISVEMYLQASKFKKENRDFYLMFSLDTPKSKFSMDIDLAKKVAESKTGLVNGLQQKPRGVVMDSDWEKRKKKEEYDAIFAKFTQNPELKRTLLMTHKAKITVYVPKEPAIIFDNLMIVRDLISKS